MNPTISVLTPQRTAVIAGRILCVFFLTYAVSNFADVPGLIIGLMHYRAPIEGIGSATYYSYWTRRHALWITGALVRGAIELWLAGFFYRAGPKVSRFLLGPAVEPQTGEGAEETA